jgi:hypothetical protein
MTFASWDFLGSSENNATFLLARGGAHSQRIRGKYPENNNQPTNKTNQPENE